MSTRTVPQSLLLDWLRLLFSGGPLGDRCLRFWTLRQPRDWCRTGWPLVFCDADWLVYRPVEPEPDMTLLMTGQLGWDEAAGDIMEPTPLESEPPLSFCLYDHELPDGLRVTWEPVLYRATYQLRLVELGGERVELE